MNRNEFATRLQQLISTARENHVPLKGAYDVRSSDPDERDFQVEITEVAKQTDL